VRVRDHVALSTVGAALLYPLVGRRVLGAWAASILIDADHYLWFCWRERRLSPLAALSYFDQPDAPQPQATRLLHSPLAISLLLLLGAGRKRTVPVAVGMAVHAAMDAYHEARLDESRSAALRRDGFTCQACGARGPYVVAHLDRQPRLLPSYRAENIVTLCTSCHRAAHARAVPSFRRFAAALSMMLTGIWKAVKG
jgi:hypothetical protein